MFFVAFIRDNEIGVMESYSTWDDAINGAKKMVFQYYEDWDNLNNDEKCEERCDIMCSLESASIYTYIDGSWSVQIVMVE